jgi:hypothetical protein
MSVRDGAGFPGRNGSIVVVDSFGPVVYPTSSEQNAAIAITIAFAAAALVVVTTRVAGRLSTRQFGCGESLTITAVLTKISIPKLTRGRKNQMTGWYA